MLRRLLWITLGLLAACTPEPVEPEVRPVASLRETGELVVLIRNGATSLYVDAEGKYAGLDYDLVTRFAEELGVKVKFVIAPRVSEMPGRMILHEAHLGVGMVRRERQGLQFGPAYTSQQPVLVYRSADPRPASLGALGDGVLMVSGLFAPTMRNMRASYPKLRWSEARHQDTEELIEKVDSGLIDYAIVDTQGLELAQNFHPGVAVAFPVADALPFAWAWPADAPQELGKQAKEFFERIRKDGTLARLLDRYYGHANRLQPVDATTFLSRRLTVLPKYRRYFMDAEAQYGIDWRMLAALSYQESHWDAYAVSDYGVRGLMMLTTDTADRLGVTNRLDPEQSVSGGAKYVAMLKDRLAVRIAEPDRTWIALASYNIGVAHLEDARVLAQRGGKNPDSWSDLKTVIPLLRNYEYFSTLKYGFARGGETVIFVENVRSYYDILVRFEKPLKLMFPPFNEQVTVANPEGVRLGIAGRGK
ncbi:membrane-bound lytic murein transglycosylase MltF [Chitinimonas arctica]|uniref:Membrane-bound lytic murein transglycosylase F n=1 Tax=Chitinimonas arctica TaxID=2594795 RepID=A0A516SCQ3_9NEIS|nr:membrane-bound lytic murein transglycosylase MltF [Chitinimonas arctica]QDQ25933.1 membrane-bound lytic murein transglycosylase MltF [Chitinimonas arctica]